MNFIAAMAVAQGVFDQYKIDQPKWWKRMDGTPILNDVAVLMAEAFRDAIAPMLAAQGEDKAKAEIAGYKEILQDMGVEAVLQYGRKAIGEPVGYIDCQSPDGDQGMHPRFVRLNDLHGIPNRTKVYAIPDPFIGDLRRLLQTMINSAEQFVGAGNAVEGYKIKTGALHKIIGLFADSNQALTIPSKLPEVAAQPVAQPNDAHAALMKISKAMGNPCIEIRDDQTMEDALADYTIAILRLYYDALRVQVEKPVAQTRCIDCGEFVGVRVACEACADHRIKWAKAAAQTGVPEGYAMVELNSVPDAAASKGVEVLRLARQMGYSDETTAMMIFVDMLPLAAASTPSQYIGKDDIWTSPVTPSKQSKEGET